MVEVPRYGIHNGIKYSPRRTLVRWCIICGNPFHPTGRRDKVCSDECRSINNKNTKDDHNFKNSHKYPSVYQPPKDEQERRRRNNYWKVWYANMTPEQRKRYNTKKKQSNKKVRKNTDKEEYDSIQAELKALGLR